jgi:hypothetical protein
VMLPARVSDKAQHGKSRSRAHSQAAAYVAGTGSLDNDVLAEQLYSTSLSSSGAKKGKKKHKSKSGSSKKSKAKADESADNLAALQTPGRPPKPPSSSHAHTSAALGAEGFARASTDTQGASADEFELAGVPASGDAWTPTSQPDDNTIWYRNVAWTGAGGDRP